MHREFNNKTHIVFVLVIGDLLIEQIQKNYGVCYTEELRRDNPQHLTEVIKSMRDDTKICIAGNKNMRKSVYLGLRQG